MKLVVGLGNPGRKYQATRHNVGFDVVGELARRHGDGKPRARFEGETVDASLAGERTLLLCPLTYMNRSGLSVLQARDFYKLQDEDILVVCDDFNLDLAQLRFRLKGSAGGQKGLGDIITRLGTQEFSRLRIGIGPAPPGWDAADFVLGKMDKQQSEVLKQAVDRAADAVVDWARQGTAFCMNKYNAANSDSNQPKTN